MKPWTWCCRSSPGKLSSAAVAGRDATSARADTARTKRIPATRSFQPEKIAVCPNSVSTHRCPSASFQCPVNTVLMTRNGKLAARGALDWRLVCHPATCAVLPCETEAKALAKDCQGAEPLPE